MKKHTKQGGDMFKYLATQSYRCRYLFICKGLLPFCHRRKSMPYDFKKVTMGAEGLLALASATAHYRTLTNL